MIFQRSEATFLLYFSCLGARMLIKGWEPTCIGYHFQGMFKFGLNEVFKDLYSNMLGEQNAIKYVNCASALSA